MVHELLSADRERGATLAELVIVTVVVSLVALVFSGMFVEAVRSYRFVDLEKELLQEARYAEERITRELRRVRDATSISAATSTAITFIDRESSTIGLSWDGVKGSDLVLSMDGTPRTLAAGVDSFALDYRTESGAPAVPIVSPSATDIRRVTIFLRLAREGQAVDAVGAAFVRSM